MGELGRLIEAYKDRAGLRDQFGRRPSNADIGRAVGVTRSTVGHWINGKMPSPEHIGPLARVTGETPARILTATLADAGYLLRERDLGGRNTAATIQAGGSPAADLDTILELFKDYVRDVDNARRAAVRGHRGEQERDERIREIQNEYVTRITAAFARARGGSSENVG